MTNPQVFKTISHTRFSARNISRSLITEYLIEEDDTGKPSFSLNMKYNVAITPFKANATNTCIKNNELIIFPNVAKLMEFQQELKTGVFPNSLFRDEIDIDGVSYAFVKAKDGIYLENKMPDDADDIVEGLRVATISEYNKTILKLEEWCATMIDTYTTSLISTESGTDALVEYVTIANVDGIKVCVAENKEYHDSFTIRVTVPTKGYRNSGKPIVTTTRLGLTELVVLKECLESTTSGGRTSHTQLLTSYPNVEFKDCVQNRTVENSGSMLVNVLTNKLVLVNRQDGNKHVLLNSIALRQLESEILHWLKHVIQIKCDLVQQLGRIVYRDTTGGEIVIFQINLIRCGNRNILQGYIDLYNYVNRSRDIVIYDKDIPDNMIGSLVDKRPIINTLFLYIFNHDLSLTNSYQDTSSFRLVRSRLTPSSLYGLVIDTVTYDGKDRITMVIKDSFCDNIFLTCIGSDPDKTNITIELPKSVSETDLACKDEVSRIFSEIDDTSGMFRKYDTESAQLLFVYYKTHIVIKYRPRNQQDGSLIEDEGGAIVLTNSKFTRSFLCTVLNGISKNISVKVMLFEEPNVTEPILISKYGLSQQTKQKPSREIIIPLDEEIISILIKELTDKGNKQCQK